MIASICMSTYNRPHLLQNTLASIYAQRVPFRYEVIVTEDGSEGDYDWVKALYPQAKWLKIDRAPGVRNPAPARNAAYREAMGDVVIAQSDEVIHASPRAIETLVRRLRATQFVIATVLNVGGPPVKNIRCYTSPRRQRPLFFLGALWRQDLYAVGGNDEEFRQPACEDIWFAQCLMRGQRLTPRYTSAVVGHHQHHPRMNGPLRVSKALLRRKLREAEQTGQWIARGGPWT
jgi:glycosyltransferase involved in cell wall biosynthesis